MQNEPAFASSTHLQIFAISLVHERGKLFKLQCGRVLGEKGDNVPDAAFMRGEHLKRSTDKEQIVLDDTVRVEDCNARIKAVGEKQEGAFVFHREA